MLVVLKELFDNPYFVGIGTLASIISLAVSIYAALGIRRVKKAMISASVLPGVVDLLRGHAGVFARVLGDFPTGQRDFELELSVCEANLKGLKGKVSGEPRRTVSKLLSRISRYSGSKGILQKNTESQRTMAAAWEIYTSLNGCIQELANFIEERKLG